MTTDPALRQPPADPRQVELRFRSVAQRIAALSAIVGGTIGVAVSLLHVTADDSIAAGSVVGFPFAFAAFTSAVTTGSTILYAPHWFFGGTPGRLRPERVGVDNYRAARTHLVVLSGVAVVLLAFSVRHAVAMFWLGA